MGSKAKHIIVHGRVQGVGFRFFVQRIGSRLGLTGNDCNCDDGTVEIVVEGNPHGLIEFVHEVRRGPPMSHVDRLEVEDILAEGGYSTFQIEGW